MNIQYNPASGLIDILLRDVAKRIQLPPSSYQTAVERYQTMDRHLNRESSAIKDMISRLYPQGSIAIGAVVSSKFDNDEFDVDAIVELHIAASSPPAAVLDLLHAAIAGEKGSRYHDMTRRQSRCVTVDYDSMHIDFTPAVLMPSLLERTSTIFHANENDHFSKHYHKVANPWGFGEWFKTQTPLQVVFAEDAALRKTAEPLPDFARINEKSLPLIALQMIKRWRNGRYTNRNGRRMPPFPAFAIPARAVGLPALVGLDHGLHIRRPFQAAQIAIGIEVGVFLRAVRRDIYQNPLGHAYLAIGRTLRKWVPVRAMAEKLVMPRVSIT